MGRAPVSASTASSSFWKAGLQVGLIVDEYNASDRETRPEVDRVLKPQP